MNLTNATLKSLPVGKKVADGAGLYYRATAKTKGKWSYRFFMHGRSYEMGLGSYPAISLKDARAKHAKQRKLFIDGKNPIVTRKSQIATTRAKEARTFSDVAEMLIQSKRAAWTNTKSEHQWRSSLETYAYPILDAKPLSELTTEDVVNVLKPHWNTKTETMSRVRQRMNATFTYAGILGWYEGKNPATWEYHLANIFSKPRLKGHHASLPYQRLPWFFESLQHRTLISSFALQFTILTAARTSEVISATFEEIDFNKGIWRVPAHRMKMKAAHNVPLSRFALTLIERIKRLHNHAYIFPGLNPESGLSNGAMYQMIRKGYPDEVFTVHGFRTTFRTWAAEVGDYDQTLAEIALAHSQHNKIEAAYQRSDLIDKRRIMMDDFAKFATSAMSDTTMISH